MKNYRNHFPMINEDYIYLNSASTSLKPTEVINAINEYYSSYSVNLSRGVDSLSYNVTKMFEETRTKVASFIGANKNEIVFNRGTTEGINFIALTIGNEILNENDEIIVSIHEHHANFIPWLELCKKKNAKLIIVPTRNDGTVDPLVLNEYMNDKVKIVSLNHVSNVFGSTNDIKKLAEVVHKYNAYFVVDGAQGIVLNKIDVKDLDVDFYLFSAHKLYGPTGLGIMYYKYNILENIKPLYFGGEMIESVDVDYSTYKKPPYCFEAGTMMISSVLGFSKAIDFVNSINLDEANEYVHDLKKYLVKSMRENINDVIIYNEDAKSHIVSFNIVNIHPHDIASLLDKNKIIVRAGHHCAEPLIKSLGISGTVRVSLNIYNTKEEIDYLISILKKAGDYLDVIF